MTCFKANGTNTLQIPLIKKLHESISLLSDLQLFSQGTSEWHSLRAVLPRTKQRLWSDQVMRVQSWPAKTTGCVQVHASMALLSSCHRHKNPGADEADDGVSSTDTHALCQKRRPVKLLFVCFQRRIGLSEDLTGKRSYTFPNFNAAIPERPCASFR